jgi:epoxyqueuosine reductase
MELYNDKVVKKISQQIKEQAIMLGFADCGFASLEPFLNDGKRLKHWLSRNYHGSMAYMENYFDKRVYPNRLLNSAKSVIVVLLNYKPEKVIPKSQPQIAKYAYGIDYHFIIKRKLNLLLQKINAEIVQCNGVAFTDSAPVFERAFAVRAGLGWLGKNSMLINHQFGSYTLIGELFVDIPLAYGTIVENNCGNCRKCIDACPTNTINGNKTINATRCISYLTIEHRKKIDNELTGKLGNRIFGCDDCIDVCPHNQKTPFHFVEEFLPSENFYCINWRTLTRGQFNIFFKHSALKRTGYKKIVSSF